MEPPTSARLRVMAVTTHIPGLVLTEHEFTAPLRYSEPDGEQITLFAREVAVPEGRDRPFLVFLQGGPGMEAPRPTSHPSAPGWLERALQDYRVLMLDQRGTGRSAPIAALEKMSPEQQASYLACFRADSIVDDAELIRHELGLGAVERARPVFRRLLRAPLPILGARSAGRGLSHRRVATGREAPRRGLPRHLCPNTGALSPILRTLPGGQGTGTVPANVDDGERSHPAQMAISLTPRMFRQLGWMLGMSDGAEKLHYILELPAGSRAFLRDVEEGLPPFSRNPLYAVIHEACYSDGAVTNWSAARVQPEEYQEQPELFTGEHVFPWMFEDYGALRPLREAADLLARQDWPRLYNPERLRGCEVPAAAAIYADDMYVERSFSEETAGHGPVHAGVADQRVRAQRAASRRRPRAGPANRPGQRSLRQDKQLWRALRQLIKSAAIGRSSPVRHGAVAANHPLAAQAGLVVLRQGGNAVDAGVATALALGVVEPMMSGLGGDGFYHVLEAKTGKSVVFNGTGPAPRAASPERYATGIPRTGPLSASVPGMLAGLGEMHRHYGSLPWARLCDEAVRLARDGFGATAHYRSFSADNVATLGADKRSATVFLRGWPGASGGGAYHPA